MPTSIFIARLLGPVFIILGVAILIRPDEFRTMIREFAASRSLMFLAGVLGLVGGLAVVLTHNVWVQDWRLIITVIGWGMIVRAVVTIFLPQQMVALVSKLAGHNGFFYGTTAADLVIGVALSYFGYRA